MKAKQNNAHECCKCIVESLGRVVALRCQSDLDWLAGGWRCVRVCVLGREGGEGFHPASSVRVNVYLVLQGED